MWVVPLKEVSIDVWLKFDISFDVNIGLQVRSLCKYAMKI